MNTVGIEACAAGDAGHTNGVKEPAQTPITLDTVPTAIIVHIVLISDIANIAVIAMFISRTYVQFFADFSSWPSSAASSCSAPHSSTSSSFF